MKAGPAALAEYQKPGVDALLRALTEATRARPGVNPLFILPAGAGDATANYNHFVFGQRGSGKSSLLRHLESEKVAAGRAAVWIDQEIFTDLQYPDVLVSCVLEIAQGLATALRRVGIVPKRSAVLIWLRRVFRVPGHPLEDRLTRMITNLRTIKFSPVDADVQWTHRITSDDQREALGTIKAGPFNGNAGRRASKATEVTSTQTVNTSKSEYLERSLADFRKLISECSQALGGGFVFVDDLYLIARSDQPRVLGYLHRLLKDSGLWLKIGSIRYATNNYVPGDPPVGMQTRHDAHEVALDRQFSHSDTTKQFLEQILSQLGQGTGADVQALFSAGALDRLMLASGGVVRDYLALARGAVEEARERGPGTKSGSHRVTVEDVNAAAGKIAPSKFEDLREDAPEEADALRARVIDLTNFCRDRKSAYFLVDGQDRSLKGDLDALQHLRFAHLLVQSETIPDRQSQRFNVYLLDIAQLSDQRATQGVDFDGWQERERRRNRRLVYSPDWAAGQNPRGGTQERPSRPRKDQTPAQRREQVASESATEDGLW